MLQEGTAMEKFEDCTLRGERFEHDSETCEHNRCMKCNSGTWEITDAREDEEILF
jgi:hypothetical protein